MYQSAHILASKSYCLILKIGYNVGSQIPSEIHFLGHLPMIYAQSKQSCLLYPFAIVYL